jgi:hypothetical protein
MTPLASAMARLKAGGTSKATRAHHLLLLSTGEGQHPLPPCSPDSKDAGEEWEKPEAP